MKPSTLTNEVEKDHIYANRHSYFTTTVPVRTEQEQVVPRS